MNTLNPNPISPSSATQDERNWAVILHLSVLANAVAPFAGFAVPVIIWAIKKDQSAYLNQVGKEVINFVITCAILGAIFSVLIYVVIGIPLVALLYLWCIILPIIAAIKTSQSENYLYPLTMRLLK